MTRFTSITPNLMVRDIAASTAFYRDVLGFSVKQTVPDAEYHTLVAPKASVIMPLKTQFYGMREFAILDPDGHIITFAERVAGN